MKRSKPLARGKRCPTCGRPPSKPTRHWPGRLEVCCDRFHAGHVPDMRYALAHAAPKAPSLRPRRKPLPREGPRARRERGALEAFRKTVLERAGGRCERCRSKALPLHAHHTLRRPKADGRHDPKLGAALCTPCHDAIHSGSPDSKLWLVSTKPGRA